MTRPPFFPVPRDLVRTSPIWNQRRRERTEPEALIDLYSMATHVPYEWSSPHGVDPLNPGEFVASLRYLAERWKWSKDRCARFLARASKARHITRQRQGHNGTVYRVEGLGGYGAPGREIATRSATETSPLVGTDVRQNREMRDEKTLAARVFSISHQPGAQADYTTSCTIALNRGLARNPHLRGAAREVSASTQVGRVTWEQDGIPLDVATFVVERLAAEYVPNGSRNRQLHSLKYCDGAVREEWERVRVRGITSAADVPGAKDTRDAARLKAMGY